MGDRCWMKVTCFEGAKQKFEDLGFQEEEKDEGGVVIMVDEEANWAHSGDLEELGKDGLTFISVNGPGGEYGNGACAAVGGQFMEVQLTHDEDLMVRVLDSGEVDAQNLEGVRAFIKLRDKAKQALGVK